MKVRTDSRDSTRLTHLRPVLASRLSQLLVLVMLLATTVLFERPTRVSAEQNAARAKRNPVHSSEMDPLIPTLGHTPNAREKSSSEAPQKPQFMGKNAITTKKDSDLELHVLSPHFNPTFRTTGAGVELFGTATGPNQVIQISWSSNFGEFGIAQGSLSWRSGRIPLAIGNNAITVMATDTSNSNVATTLTVERLATLGEQSFSDDVRAAFYRGQQVTYSIVDGLAIFEGDIVLGTVDQLDASRKGGITTDAGGISPNSRLWTNGVVPYTLGPNPTNDLQPAIDHWNSYSNYTGVTLVPRTNQSNYLTFNRSDVCNSYVGMQGGVQTINYGLCGFGGTVHEIGHAIGLWHEQSRNDRNSYVTINYSNIESGQEHNFNQYGVSGIDIGAYDYDSIMHYGAYAFSANGQPTIVPTTSGVTIGQRNGLSSRDVDGVKSLYCVSNCGSNCAYTLTPTSRSFNASGGSNSFTVTTGSSCSWTATVNAPSIPQTSLPPKDATPLSLANVLNIQTTITPNATEAVFLNATPITINDRTSNSNPPATGSLYPSTINVSGMTGTITLVQAALNGVSHTFPDDIDVVLVGPGGQRVILMSDVGGNPDVAGVDLIFEQTAGVMPDSTQVVSGTYRPTNFNSNTSLEPGGIDIFPSPGPGQSTYAADLSVFNGTSPNGTWRLYVVDDESADSGSIANGWAIGIVTSGGGTTWINITSGSSGTGNGTVNYTVSANTGANQRTGTITVNGKTHTITQSGNCNAPGAFSLNTPSSGQILPSTTSVNLTWGGSANANSYDVYFGSGSNPPFLANQTGTSRTVGVTPGQTYWWKVVAKVSCGSATYTAGPRSFSVQQTCNAPGAFSLSSPSSGQSLPSTTSVNLTWGGSANANSYDVYFGTSSNPPFVANQTGTSRTVSVTPGQTYYWKVVAKVSCGSATSTTAIRSFSVQSVCNAPGAFSLSSPSNGQSLSSTTSLNLTWGGSANANSYDVYFGTSSNPPFVANQTGTIRTVSVTPGQTYFWKVVAKVNCGSATSTAGVWSFSVQTSCNAPGTFSLSSPSNGQSLGSTASVNLTWGGSANANSYDVYFGTSSNPPFVANQTGTSRTVSVTPGQTYWWKIIARVGCNASLTSTAGTRTFNVQNPPTATVLAVYSLRGDFDGDGRADVAVWRPSTATWYIINSSNGSTRIQTFGAVGDVPVPADYDGDTRTDLAVWRPSSGVWYIINSSNGSIRVQTWGAAGDIPTPADYDGDNRADIGVWRPSTAIWYIINSSTGSARSEGWGQSNDVPLPGDYDGDGKADIAVWQPSTGQWNIINSSNGSVRQQVFGTNGDIPVPTRYDGDGKTDIAVWRPSTGQWYVLNSSDGSLRQQGWGTGGDIPVPASYDGDGKTDIAVWRPSTGQWYILNSSNGSLRQQGLGAQGDLPVSRSLVIR